MLAVQSSMTTEVRRALAAVPNRSNEVDAHDSSHRSGLRPATGVFTLENETDELISVLAVARTGRVADPLVGSEAHALDDFRSTLPELFAPAGTQLTFDASHEPAVLRDLVLISPKRVHVAQRVPRDPSLVLVSVSNRSSNIGLVVSEARARLRDV